MSSASRAPTTTALPTITTGGRVPILSWATPLEGSALEQARNLANLPFAIDHVALMPDAHTGYGMPIGGVLFADRAVVPYAIGVDIGCGVAFVETDLTVDRLDRATLDRLLGEIARRVPTGTSGQSYHVDRDAALAEIGLPLPESIKSTEFERAVDCPVTLGGGDQLLELAAAGLLPSRVLAGPVRTGRRMSSGNLPRL